MTVRMCCRLSLGGDDALTGIALATMASRSVVGAEPTGAGADDAFRSSTIGGTFHPSVNPKTLADGLLTSTYEIMFPLIMEHVDASYTQSPVNKLCKPLTKAECYSLRMRQ
ncbi:hypothetical protein JB92DRAFT_2945687 [Gautieria morchelliformis]|nr:hypothetical protein JB92DRAFT_2945687 [Gautieria morchelliformis]